MNNILEQIGHAATLEDALVAANKELRKFHWKGRRIKILQRGGRLVARGTLPNKDPKAVNPKQYYVSLGDLANIDGVKDMTTKVMTMIEALQNDCFNWEDFSREGFIKRNINPGWENHVFWKGVLMGERHECWPWLKCKNQGGYGIAYANKSKWAAHRLAYSIVFKDYQGDPLRYVCHKCDNPSCVNPFHLFQATAQENMKDSGLSGIRSLDITEREIFAIKTLRNSGVSVKTLAQAWQCSKTTIIKKIS